MATLPEDAFPNPYDPPASENRNATTSEAPSAPAQDSEEDELSRALRASLVVQQDQAQKRQDEEEAMLQEALRASEAEHAMQQREREQQQQRIEEIMEESRREAYRDQRRREAEKQRHALLEMEIIAQSRQEHERRIRALSPGPPDSHSIESAPEMEALLWLRARPSILTPGGSLSQGVPIQDEAEHQAPEAPSYQEPTNPWVREPTPPSPDQEPELPKPVPPESHTLSRYEQMFGRHEEEDDGFLSDAPESPWSRSDDEPPVSSAEPDSCAAEAPLTEPAPEDPGWEEPTAQPDDCDASAAPAESPPQLATEAADHDLPLLPYPPEYAEGQPALRGVQFGTATHAYAMDLYAPSGAILYPTPDVASECCMPPEHKLYFPDVIELGTERPYFVLRAYSWKMLLQAMAWHGKTRVEAPSTSLYLHVALSVPRRADTLPFASPSFALLALSTRSQPLLKTPEIASFCKERQSTLTCVPLVSHPLALPTDLVTLAHTLFSAPQLSHASSLRELHQAISVEDDWLETRSQCVPLSSAPLLGALEQQCLHQQLSLHQHPLEPLQDSQDAPPPREHFRDRMRRKLSRWNVASNVAPEEDLATWITPYDLSSVPP